jgi:hypothetical protein
MTFEIVHVRQSSRSAGAPERQNRNKFTILERKGYIKLIACVGEKLPNEGANRLARQDTISMILNRLHLHSQLMSCRSESGEGSISPEEATAGVHFLGEHTPGMNRIHFKTHVIVYRHCKGTEIWQHVIDSQ